MKARAAPAGDPLADEALWSGQSRALLQDLHILTREGKLNQDARRKLKQVRHLIQLLTPAIETLAEGGAAPLIADLGAGKSYLGFLLADTVLRTLGRGRVIAVEAREELAAGARDLAERYGLSSVEAVAGTIAEAQRQITEPVGLVTALHACDTATDDALRFALARNARFVALVPCCEAELAALLGGDDAQPIAPLWRHPLHRRSFAAHATNVLRALFLEARGYRVRVTEFVGFEHSLKNELILGEKVQHGNAMAARHLSALLAALPARPAFLNDWAG